MYALQEYSVQINIYVRADRWYVARAPSPAIPGEAKGRGGSRSELIEWTIVASVQTFNRKESFS